MKIHHDTVFRIGIPNPMFEGEINLYVIAGEPLTLVDTGIGTPEAMSALEAGLAERGLSVEAVRRVVLTHKHADHIGLAQDIRERSGATVLIHEDDWENVTNLDARHEQFGPLVLQTLQRFRVPQEKIDRLAGQLGQGPRLAQQVEAEKLVDGQRLEVDGQVLEVIHTPGHTQGSICLRYGHWLFSGDHVLPTITPNVGASELRRTGMVQRFLQSLDRIATQQADDLVVLPGRAPFSNLRQRVEELKLHHAQREAAILEILRSEGGKTVYEIAISLWSKLPGYHLTLGTAEVNSHLEKAIADGLIRGDDGRFWLIDRG